MFEEYIFSNVDCLGTNNDVMRGCGSAGSFIVECRNTSEVYVQMRVVTMVECRYASACSCT